MHQVVDFFEGLFDTSLWPPRWHCGKWSEFHGWLYIISDLLIFSAYFAMPVIIVRYIASRTNARFHKIYFLFAAFILACGFTHLLDAVTFWYPMYRFNALARFITGVISWTTVYYLIKLLPVAFSLKTAEQLEMEVEQRKRAEEDLKIKIRLLNEAQEIAKMGHWEWDADKNSFMFSDNLARIFGLEQTCISYDRFLEYVHGEDRHNVDTLIKQAITGKKFSEFFHRIHAQGAVKTLLIKGEIVTNEKGQVIKIIGTGQDVTEQKNTEQELLIKSAALESKNAELQKFAYVASHDLQEPLRKIRTFISRLQEPENLSPEKEKQYMEKIVSAAIRMQKLIEDVLSFSRISSADSMFLFARTSLDTVLKSVLGDMEVMIESTRAKIHATDLPEIEANDTQMGQLFQNILGNAIKFRKEDTDPEINITAQLITGADITAPGHMRAHYKFTGWKESRRWDNEQFAKITISDNGIGFDQQFADRIFEAFQRLSATYEGTGIGLAICKKIVENHNGTITVEGRPDDGTSFVIILPVSQANFDREIE